jgi:hypothetical protein
VTTGVEVAIGVVAGVAVFGVAAVGAFVGLMKLEDRNRARNRAASKRAEQ